MRVARMTIADKRPTKMKPNERQNPKSENRSVKYQREFSQVWSGKHQTPNTKHQRNPKLQAPIRPLSVAGMVWSLRFGDYLVFGVWCLELRSDLISEFQFSLAGGWSLVPGVC